MPLASPVLTVEKVDRHTFDTELRPLNIPVLMKGQVNEWPAVKLSQISDEAVIAYLKNVDNGKAAGAMLGTPTIRGEFFYGDTLQSYNFQRGLVPISLALDRLVEQRGKAEPHAIYIQSAPIRDHLPMFLPDHKLDLLSPDVAPRIWIGNRLRVQTHHDPLYNIACGVAGKRRFTLFPPEQLVNLYIGPFEHTLAGQPVSMVSLEDPDFARYPRFRDALQQAQVADLEPGDALYLPYAWWHHVRSLDSFNILVNYWWNDAPAGLGEPYDCLLHGMLTLRDMPPPQREVWKVMFDYYVFGSHGDPVAHLSLEDKGAAGPMDPALRHRMRQQLIERLKETWPKP